MFNIGIDLGGTNIKVGIVNEKYEIVADASVKTNLPRPAESIADGICEAAEMALKKAGLTLDNINSIGIGTPGSANRETGEVLYSNNLGFRNVHLGKMLKEKLGKEIYVENDANAAAYGEYLAGGGKGYQNVIVITLGTGVGGGVIIDGKIYTGFNFCGAELGHTVIEYNGRPCTCGRKGCFEAYSSATALITATKKAMEEHKDSKMWEIAGSLENVDGKTAFDGMRADDAVAKQVVNEFIEYLGCGLTNMVNIFQPEILLIGGGLCKEGDNLVKPLREIIARDCYCIDEKLLPKLGICELGNGAGIIGAAFLFRMHETD